MAAFGVHLIKVPSVPTAVSARPPFLPFIAADRGLAVAWMLALTWFGSRDPKITGHGHIEYKRIMHATFAYSARPQSSSYLFKLELPRSYLLVMMPVGLAAVVGSRFGWRRWLHRQRDAGHYHVTGPRRRQHPHCDRVAA